MQRIVDKQGCRVWLGQTSRPYDFRSPASGMYALLLVEADGEASSAEHEHLSRQFVQSGCRYAVCFGETSSDWDDSIDYAYIDEELAGRDKGFVMTSWHDDEPLEEAVFFFAVNTRVGEWRPEDFVALVLGGEESCERVRTALMRAFGSKGN